MSSSSTSNNNKNTNNNNAIQLRQQQNAEALVATVKMLRLGTKQVTVCREALDRLQKLLTIVPAPKKKKQQQQSQAQQSSNITSSSSLSLNIPNSSDITASTSSNTAADNSTTSSLAYASTMNTPSNRLTPAEVRTLRRQFALNNVGGPGVVMNVLQVVGTDISVAESALSIMEKLLIPPSSSSIEQQQQTADSPLFFNPLLPKTKGRARITLRKLVKKFIKKSGTRLLFALLVKHFDPALPLSYIRGIVFPVCRLVHCFILGDPKFAASARLSGALQVLTRIVLAFINSTNNNVNNNNSSNNTDNNNNDNSIGISSGAAAAMSSSSSASAQQYSLVNDTNALEQIIPGILTTISTLCNVKLSLGALSRNGLGVASLLNLIRNVVSTSSSSSTSTSSSRQSNTNNHNSHSSNKPSSSMSIIITQSIIRWSFKLIFNYLIVDTSSNTKIALENNIVEICIAVLEKFSTNSSFTQLHCVILDVLTFLVYGTSCPVINEINNNNNNNNNASSASKASSSKSLSSSNIISPEREKQIIRLVARAACSPPASSSHQTNPRDIIDLYNQLTKFLGMTELPIASHTDGTDLVWSATNGCPSVLLKKGAGESSSDDDDEDEDEDGNGNDIFSKMSTDERFLVEDFEERMEKRVALMFPEFNVVSSSNSKNSNNNTNSQTSTTMSTIPLETILNTETILNPDNNFVKKIHFPTSTAPNPLHSKFSVIPPSWPIPHNAHTENVLAVEAVPDDPLPDDVFRQLAQNQFLRLVDPAAVTAQIVYDNVPQRSKQLPRIYAYPPNQDRQQQQQQMMNHQNQKSNNNNSTNSAAGPFTIPSLSFDANFECGNLKRVIRVGDADYDIITCGDTNTERQGQWFFFALKGMISGVQYTFRFINFERAGSTFGTGNRPLMYSERLYGESKSGWMRVGEEISYFKNSFLKPSAENNSSKDDEKSGKGGANNSNKKSAKATKKEKEQESGIGEGLQEPSSAEPEKTQKKKKSATAASSSGGSNNTSNKKEVTVQSLLKSQPTMNTLHVSIRFPFSNDRVFLCPGLPYSYTDLIRYLHFLPTHQDCVESLYRPPTNSTFARSSAGGGADNNDDEKTTSVKNNSSDYNYNPGCMMVQTLCETDSGLPVPLITITQLYKDDPTPLATLQGQQQQQQSSSTSATAPSYYSSQQYLRRTPISAQEIAARPVCVVSARVHPGETVSSFTAKGLIDFLVDPLNPVAKALRQSTVWKIIPMLNPDGVVHGHYRCDLHGYDLNRMFHPNPLSIRTPTVAYLNQLFKHMRTQQPNRKVVFYGDFHGHSKKTGCFTYGCGSAKKAVHGAVVESLFPAVLHSLLPGFDPEGCTYRVQAGKTATGRVVAYRNHNIRMSYTLEVSLMGGWRFAPISTCEDDEIIERDAVRRRPGVATRSAGGNGSASSGLSASMPSIGTVVVSSSDNGKTEEASAIDDPSVMSHEPELVLHTPHSLCAIGAMFAKAFYCVAENFLSCRAEDLMRITKPTTYDEHGNVVKTSIAMESLPRRGVVAEIAASLLIANARLEKKKRIQMLERKMQMSNKAVKGKQQDSKNSNNNQMIKDDENTFMGIHVPPHQAQEALAASLGISATKAHQILQQNNTFNFSNYNIGNDNNNNDSTSLLSASSLSLAKSTKKGSSSSKKGALSTQQQQPNDQHPLEDQFQVTVTWGGKQKETGVLVGGGATTGNSNIISTNIHTPLWATSISPGGLLVEKTSARQEAMRESYSQRGKTPTIFGDSSSVNNHSQQQQSGSNGASGAKGADGKIIMSSNSSGKRMNNSNKDNNEEDEEDDFDDNDDDDEEDDDMLFDDDDDDEEDDEEMAGVTSDNENDQGGEPPSTTPLLLAPGSNNDDDDQEVLTTGNNSNDASVKSSTVSTPKNSSISNYPPMSSSHDGASIPVKKRTSVVTLPSSRASSGAGSTTSSVTKNNTLKQQPPKRKTSISTSTIPQPPRMVQTSSTTTTTGSTTNNSSTTTTTTSKQAQPKTTNPSIKYAGALARNRK